MEIWEEIWDDRLDEEFEKEKKRAQDLVVAGNDLGSSGSGIREGTEEENDIYRTNYNDWEAKEVM